MIRSTYTGIPEGMLRHEYNVCDSFIRLNSKLTSNGDRLLSGWQLKGRPSEASKVKSLSMGEPHSTLLRTSFARSHVWYM